MLIDVHTHVTPAHFPPSPLDEATAKWPCMQCAGDGRATLLTGTTPFRELDSRSWDMARRIDDMARSGVGVQVLSPMPELLSYWIPRAATDVLCDTVNGFIAEAVARHPQQFRGLGAVSLQDPGHAAAQLGRFKSRFGLIGVEIGSNIDGMMLGDSRLDEFYAAAESENLTIFVHALHPLARRPAMSASYTALALFPVDIAMGAASLLMAGVLERFPRLRIGFSHGAGALPSMLGRLDKGWEISDGFSGAAALKPSIAAQGMFMDSNVYDAAQLRQLAEVVAPGRVFGGSDYPYRIMENDLAGLIERTGLGAPQQASLRRDAALAFLGERDTCPAQHGSGAPGRSSDRSAHARSAEA